MGDESLSMALDDLDRMERRISAALTVLGDLNRGNGLSYGGVSCGVCQGHSPSWDDHSRNCLSALPARIRTALTTDPPPAEPTNPDPQPTTEDA